MNPPADGIAVVFGGSGGVGAEFVRQLRSDPGFSSVISAARSDADIAIELNDEGSIAAAAAAIAKRGTPELVIIATGMLQSAGTRLPEKSWRMLDRAAMLDSFAVNAVGPALIAKHMLPLLPRDQPAVLAALSARVGSISDNRLGGWYSYRAAKAALNMLVRTLAIEAARSHPQAILAALHPGTVDTGLSRPFQRAVASEQLFTPERSVQAMLKVLRGLTPADSGSFVDWDGAHIPW